jgi:hypothetical protein
MTAGLISVVLAVAAAEEYVPPDDWRGVVALPAAGVIFLGAVFLLLKSNLGTRRAYFVEATCVFGFLTVVTLFWGFGAPGTPRFTGPQSMPGQPVDYYVPKWVAFAGDSTLADERFAIVKQYPEGFQEEADGEGEAQAQDVAAGAEDAASGGGEEISNFFGEQRGGVRLIGDNWVQDGAPLVATADSGEKVVGATFAKPFAFDADGEIPEGPDGRPLFAEEDVGQPIPEDFTVPSGVDNEVADLVTPQRFTGFAFFDPGFAFFPSLVMMALAIGGFLLHALLLARDESRERTRAVEEIVVERQPVGAARR